MFRLHGKFSVVRCTNCNLVFLNPQPTSNELKKYYVSSKYYSYKAEKKNIYSILRQYLLKRYYSPTFLSKLLVVLVRNVPGIPSSVVKGKIMDVGCGSGITLFLLKKLGWDVYGIELDKNAVKISQQNKLTNVKVGTFRELNKYPDSFFDVIRLYHVLEHINDPSGCLKIIYKKLKPGGEIIIGTPNFKSFAAKIFGRYWHNLDSPRHLYLFNYKTLKFLLKRSNYINIKIDYCSAYGITGSIKYVLEEKYGKENKFFSSYYFNLILTIIFFPLERFTDFIHLGDIIIAKAAK